MSSGVSLPIEKMTANHSVMSWNGSGLVKAEQTRWLNQGTKECVELTLLDGRTIKCTPDHRFLTSAGEWVEAKDIIIGETSLKMGIDSPLCADFFDHCDYKFEAGEMKFDMSSHSDRLKAMAFCRLMGYQLTDGSQNTSMYLGHLLDANHLLDDVELLHDRLLAFAVKGGRRGRSAPPGNAWGVSGGGREAASGGQGFALDPPGG